MRRKLQVHDKLCSQGLVLAPEQNQRPLAFLLVVQFPRQVDIWRHQKRRTHGILFNFQSMNNSSRYIRWSFDSLSTILIVLRFYRFLWFKSISWQISSDYKFLKNIPLLNSEETLINPKRTQIENTNLWFITSNKRAVYIESNKIKKSCMLKDRCRNSGTGAYESCTLKCRCLEVFWLNSWLKVV